MQCLSCQLENMPGTRQCARCGSPMDLAERFIAVDPPRARRWSKTLRRRYLALQRWINNVFRQLSTPRQQSHTWLSYRPSLVLQFLFPWLWLSQSIRPSLTHLLVSLWIAALLSWMVFFGSTLSSIALGLAISLHVYGVSRIFALSMARLTPFSQLLLAMVWYLLIGVGLYGGLGGLITGFYAPITINQVIGDLKSGDVVVARKRLLPRLTDGMLVVYRPDPRLHRRVNFQHYYVEQKPVLQLGILAGAPGERIYMGKTPRILRDHEPLHEAYEYEIPSGSVALDPRISLRGEVLDLPFERQQLIDLVTFYPDEIQGVIFWQTWPPWRWGPMKTSLHYRKVESGERP